MLSECSRLISESVNSRLEGEPAPGEQTGERTRETSPEDKSNLALFTPAVTPSTSFEAGLDSLVFPLTKWNQQQQTSNRHMVSGHSRRWIQHGFQNLTKKMFWLTVWVTWRLQQCLIFFCKTNSVVLLWRYVGSLALICTYTSGSWFKNPFFSYWEIKRAKSFTYLELYYPRQEEEQHL